ncbi:Protein of unknown function [Frankineae bacterium MT45]|nr:Protein of unknown function [Frankineae bacterium MT45]
MWLYTLLRVLIFAVLFGLLWLVGVKGLLGALIAAVLSIPVSFVLLARPRAMFAATIEENIQTRLEKKQARAVELDPDAEEDADGYVAADRADEAADEDADHAAGAEADPGRSD